MAGGKAVNQTELSDIIDVSAVTLRAWEKEGMPVLAKGSRGKSATYNTADVIRWCEARLVSRYSAHASESVDVISEDEGKRRKVVAEAQLAELKLDTERGALVEIEAVGQEVDAVMSRVRSRLLAIPGTLALTLTNEPDPVVVRDRVFDEVSGALNELSTVSYGGAVSASAETDAVLSEEPGATTETGSGPVV